MADFERERGGRQIERRKAERQRVKNLSRKNERENVRWREKDCTRDREIEMCIER